MINMNLIDGTEKTEKVDITYKIPVKFWERLKEKKGSISLGTKRLVYATASISAIIVATFSGIRFYNTTYQIMLADDLLKENYRVYMAYTPRLSGGFAPTGISTLMGDEKMQYTFLDHALKYINKALQSDNEFSSALYMKAKIMIINKEYDNAESIFQEMGERNKLTVPMLNDLGILYFNQNKIEKAINCFQQIQHRDPEYKESYYNLAVMMDRLEKKSEAITALEKYLELETNEEWLTAAEQIFE